MKKIFSICLNNDTCRYCQYNKTNNNKISLLNVKIYCDYNKQIITPPQICAAKTLTKEGWDKLKKT